MLVMPAFPPCRDQLLRIARRFFLFAGCCSGQVSARVPGRGERGGAVLGNAWRGAGSVSVYPGGGVDHRFSEDISSPWMRVLYIVTMGTQEAGRETGTGLVYEQHSQPHDVRLRVEALLAYRSGDQCCLKLYSVPIERGASSTWAGS
jgi:hypothetical protein